MNSIISVRIYVLTHISSCFYALFFLKILQNQSFISQKFREESKFSDKWFPGPLASALACAQYDSVNTFNCFILGIISMIFGLVFLIPNMRASPILPDKGKSKDEFIATYKSLKKPLKDILDTTRNTMIVFVSSLGLANILDLEILELFIEKLSVYKDLPHKFSPS